MFVNATSVAFLINPLLVLLLSGSVAVALRCRHQTDRIIVIRPAILSSTRPAYSHHATPGTPPPTTAATVVDAGERSAPEAPVASAEVDAAGRPYLASEKWQKMGGMGDERPGLVERVLKGLYGDLPASDLLRVAWLAGTLFFIIGG